MIDQQLNSMPITLFAAAAGSIFNSVRISDSSNAINKRIDDLRAHVDQTLELRFTHLDQKLDRIAETLTTVIADHEKRIRDFEHK